MSSRYKHMDELIDSNDELENYFSNTIIPQLFVDAKLKLRKFTPPAMKQFNLSTDDLGKSMEDIIDNFRFQTIVEDIQGVITSNRILEKEIQTTDLRWYQMNILPYVRRQDGITNGVIITFVDITMRIKDLKDLEMMVAEYEILLDTISHDIKNPLTNLVMAMSLLKKDASAHSENYATLLGSVDSAVAKMHKAITELTETRQEKHKYRPQEELLDINQVVEDVRLALNDNIKAADARIMTDIQAPQVYFSRRKLRTVIFNLVNNAIKFKDAERKLEISIIARREQNHTLITVKDNGVGIQEGELDAIFTKYYRSRTKVEGTGIGLYLVKEIVTKSGGDVRVKSLPGQHTEFSIFIADRN